MAVVNTVLNEVVEAEVADVTRTAAEYVSVANRYKLLHHFSISGVLH